MLWLSPFAFLLVFSLAWSTLVLSCNEFLLHSWMAGRMMIGRGDGLGVHPAQGSNWAAWAISIVNGFWGDYLQEAGNGLEVEMAFYQHGRALTLDKERLAAAQPEATGRVCILVHGLACNEHLWALPAPTAVDAAPQPPADYGTLLRDELGFTPYYLRYNSGLAVATNGKALAELLDQLYTQHPVPIEEILIIAHSMGGLIVRSACHYGVQHAEPWVQAVKHVFYLGTPHDGADLARLAHTAEVVLHAVPNPITRLIGDVFGVRSQGIKDLRHGTLIEPDVIDEGSDDVTHHHQRAVPWLAHAQHYLVAGTVRGDANHIAAVLLGDGLVSAPAAEHAVIPPANIRLFPGVRHLQLAHHAEVYQQIKQWRQQAEPAGE